MIELWEKWIVDGCGAAYAASPEERIGDVKAAGAELFNAGADGLLIEDRSEGDRAHDLAIETIKAACAAFSGPVWAYGNIRRFEDIKKLLYAGCDAALVDGGSENAASLREEGSARFGAERVGTIGESCAETADRHLSIASDLPDAETADRLNEDRTDGCADAPDSGRTAVRHSGVVLLSESRGGAEIFALRKALNESGVAVGYAESALAFSDLKVNADGLIPAVAQDVRTGEVLMLAWMNEESWNRTLQSGKMTYWSRSRQCLWTKGETSGHVQYVKSLTVDCDRDTILARVDQVGAACHTGNRSCFYTPVFARGRKTKNPQEILNDVYGVILDRKAHPKEGSYTNYLFDKGIDKILKKVGEENAEIIIAAKNPDPEEIKYEIADYLYHLMVLMAEKGVTWEEITDELARR